jgi:hypothetical protein
VLPVEDDTARLVRGPDLADDRDCLLERLDGLAGGAARPPIASIASQPAPILSSRRPPESKSTEAAAQANMTGGRSGRFSTLWLSRSREVRAATYVRRLHVSRKPDEVADPARETGGPQGPRREHSGSAH